MVTGIDVQGKARSASQGRKVQQNRDETAALSEFTPYSTIVSVE
jgi:hypothetical protein